jgi:hypothetical protein
MQKLVIGAAVVMVLAAASGVAQAQNKAAGEAAFQKAKKLQADGKMAEACDAFEQSQKLDAQLGTQYNLARCWENLGKLASAWGEYTELAAKDTNPGRRADSEKRVKALAPRLDKLALTVKARTPGLAISRDGTDVTLLVDVDTPIDPGTYVFKATAQGYKEWSSEVKVTGEGQRVAVEVPGLEKLPDTVGPVGPDHPDVEHPDVGPSITGPAHVDHGEPTKSNRKLIAYGVGGAGIVATGVGLLFGAQAKGLKGEADDLCNGDTSMCPADKIDDANKKIDKARSKATISTIGVGVGVAAIVGGVVLYLTAPSGESQAESAWLPVVGGDQLGFAYTGSF